MGTWPLMAPMLQSQKQLLLAPLLGPQRLSQLPLALLVAASAVTALTALTSASALMAVMAAFAHLQQHAVEGTCSAPVA